MIQKLMDQTAFVPKAIQIEMLQKAIERVKNEVSEVVTHCPDCGIDVRTDIHGFRLLHSLFDCSLTDAECHRLTEAADAAAPLERGWTE